MKDLLSLLRAKPLLTAELLTASLCINLLSLAPSVFFILVFNRYVTSGFDGTLITLTAGMVLAVVLKALFGQARNRLTEEVGGDREPLRLRQAFQILLRARTSALARLPRNQAMEALQAPQAGQAAFSPQNIGAVLDAPFAVLSVLAVFLLSTALGLITLAAVLVTLVLSFIGLQSGRAPLREVGEAVAASRQTAAQALQDTDTVRLFGGQGALAAAWDAQVWRIRDLRRAVFRAEGMSQTGLEFAALLARAAVIAVGASLVVAGELTVGALIGASFLSGMPIAIVSRFVRAFSVLAQAQEQGEKLRGLGALPVEPDQGLAVDAFKGRLDFQDLAYAWPGAPGPLFESLTLRLEAGGFLAVSGRNGTGKTTLARMLAGLLEPDRGQILIDGLDLRQVAPAWWRRQIVYLPQEPSFIRGTVGENIRLANPDMAGENLGRVIAQSGLKPFLNAQPKGLELMVEDGGRALSPGIRRRLALARALATDGRLVILDDPTEALDAEGCKTVLDVIRTLAAEGRTMVVLSNDVRILAMASTYLDLNAKPVPLVTRTAHGQEGKP